MKPDPQTPPLIDAFISYGRKESKHFAMRVKSYLESQGLKVWLDLEEIDVGTDWQDRIDKGIASAKNFIFLISPHAISSPHCKKEIELALAYSKRIIPVMHIERDIDKLNNVISEINFLFIREKEDTTKLPEDWESIDDFDKGVGVLTSKIEENESYNLLHTSLLLRALEWENNNKRKSFLLYAQERIDAQKHLENNKRLDVPNPFSPIHCEYICEARKNAENMMADAFFAYDDNDLAIVREINQELQKSGTTTWLDKQDMKPGSDLRESLQEGIELSDNVIFVISKRSVVSEICLEDLCYATSLGKRIIPIICENVDKEHLPKELSNLNSIDLTDNDPNKVKIAKKDKSDFDRDMDELMIQLEDDREYFHKHKQLLVQALKWERMGESDSFLLRGTNLLQSQEWLDEGKHRKVNAPTSLHDKFIATSMSKIGILSSEVFISYSQKDADFARKLNLKLQSFRKTTWFDQESIASASNFEEEIKKGISTSDNFLFIISPNSLASEFCEEEVRFAAEMGKRFITVLLDDVDPETMPAALKEVQWIDFKENKFDIAFSSLMHTLNIDREHVKEHTRLQQKAAEWDKQGRKKVLNFLFRRADVDLLLKKSEFVQSQVWFSRSLAEKKIPTPTPLQKEYLRICSRFLKTRRHFWLSLLVMAMLAPPIYMIYSVKESKEKEALNYLYAAKQVLDKEHDPMRALSIAKEASLLISNKSLNKLLPVLREISNSLSEHTLQFERPVRGLSIPRNGSDTLLVTYAGNKLMVRDLRGKKINENAEVLFPEPIRSLVFGIDRAFVLGMDKKVYAVDIGDGQNLEIQDVSDYGTATGIHLFDGGGGVFVTQESGAMRLYSQLKERWVWMSTFNHSMAVEGMAISPDQTRVFTYSKDKTGRLWSLKKFSNNFLDEIKIAPNTIKFAEFSEDGEKLLTHFSNNDVVIWHVENNRLVMHTEYSGVTYVRFTSVPDLVLIQEGGNRVSLREVDGSFFRELATFSQLEESIDGVILSENKKVVLTYRKDGHAAVWELNGELLGEVDFSREESPTDLVRLSPRGKLILRTDKSGTVSIWEANGEEFAVLKAHKSKISHIGFSIEKEKLITVSDEGVLKAWSASDTVLAQRNLEQLLSNNNGNLKTTINKWFDKHSSSTMEMAEVDRLRFGIIRDYQEVIASEDSSLLHVYANYFKNEIGNMLNEEDKKLNLERSLAIYNKINELEYGSVYSQVEVADLRFELELPLWLAQDNLPDFDEMFTLASPEQKHFVAQYLIQKYGSQQLALKIKAFEKVEELYNEILEDNVAGTKHYSEDMQPIITIHFLTTTPK
ncbi:TIR domain-containing protein [Flammeovirgaceae bacterium SG7u.111]|nr:TIR domain-containing protein [Flammeovirgaceae bacterium SG7u.132]WPO34986.1 TIR domain-containing protein [Flammeovirgaceae bacterium SG7u.111]